MDELEFSRLRQEFQDSQEKVKVLEKHAERLTQEKQDLIFRSVDLRTLCLEEIRRLRTQITKEDQELREEVCALIEKAYQQAAEIFGAPKQELLRQGYYTTDVDALQLLLKKTLVAGERLLERFKTEVPQKEPSPQPAYYNLPKWILVRRELGDWLATEGPEGEKIRQGTKDKKDEMQRLIFAEISKLRTWGRVEDEGLRERVRESLEEVLRRADEHFRGALWGSGGKFYWQVERQEWQDLVLNLPPQKSLGDQMGLLTLDPLLGTSGHEWLETSRQEEEPLKEV